jgi:hypothetical protein
VPPLAAALLLALVAGVTPAAAQFEGEWGDAPEGVIAYPALGVMGNFPTCFGGPAGFVYHGLFGAPVMFWGPTADIEMDGNAGICPPPPYEQDECWTALDGDAGIIAPETFTIAGGVVVPCGTGAPTSLGIACTAIPVGPTFDARVTNNLALDGFVNVIFDWDQSGTWGGAAPCPTGPAPEHAIVNVPIPAGYAGLLSGLFPGPIQLGPRAGYVWVRMTVSDQPVPQGWDGSGFFELGESEDYLLRVDPDQEEELGDYGDAPEDALAYPGILGEFPTCTMVGPAGFVYHGPIDLVFFGPLLDWELDGNAGTCPQPPYDLDECDVAGGDAGFTGPTVFSLTAAGTPVPCGPGQSPDLTGCFRAKWGVDLDIFVNNFTSDERWVNVLADWDDDAKWTGALTTCPDGTVADEHVLVDFPVPPGFSGPLSLLGPPDFTVGMPPLDFAWFRFTIGDQMVGPGWNGEFSFGDGESEDYLLRITPAPIDAPELGLGSAGRARLEFQSVRPNPMRDQASVRLTTDRGGVVRLAVYDATGRKVTDLGQRAVDAGVQTFTWDGRDASGRDVGPGVYFLRATMGREAANAKVVVVR